MDLSAAELCKRGRRVTLQEQPLQVLALLLRRAGDVVTREELQQALWPSDTFVEFDQGLNKAIQKIRQALGDLADNPCFVETVPRRGYRFIAPVEILGKDDSAVQTVERLPPETEVGVVPSPKTVRRIWRWRLPLGSSSLSGPAGLDRLAPCESSSWRRQGVRIL
jgi:DNA-binding winged helix-turn-helix (wHTH) protein